MSEALWTALEVAMDSNTVDPLRHFLEAGDNINIDARDEGGRSPLMVASGGAVEIVALLITQGADVNARTDDGETPLMGAAASGSVATVDALIAAGADPIALDKSGTTAMEYAAIKGHAAIVRYFRDNHPMDAEAIRRSKFVAEVFDHPQVVEILSA